MPNVPLMSSGLRVSTKFGRSIEQDDGELDDPETDQRPARARPRYRAARPDM